MDKIKDIKEKTIKPINGWGMLAVAIVCFIAAIGVIAAAILSEIIPLIALAIVFLIIGIIISCGIKVLNPNEAYVFTLFGKYYGSLKEEGFYWVNPFCVAFNPNKLTLDEQLSAVAGQGTSSNTDKASLAPGVRNSKISLKAMTLNNDKQKVNDSEGNPIEIGVVVIWKIVDTAKALFAVDSYYNYISIQADAVIRNIARQYPYDIAEDDGDEKSLRGSSQEIAKMLCEELQQRVEFAGIEIVEARISHLAYAQEIAAAMLQRQQAKAVVDARTKIVEGAVGMVELALDKLKQSGCVDLDNKMKAEMVSNLMVVLCSNKDTQPVVNSSHKD